MNLTEKQQMVYLYLRDYIEARGMPPTYDEIRRHFGFKSFQSVQKHLAQLERKGYIRIPERNRSRMITLVEHGGSTVLLRLAGVVAAGTPTESIEQMESIEVPKEMLGSGDYFALRVRGDSMVDEGIMDGDTIVVRRQSTALNGQTVVALVDGEATIKKFYRMKDRVELRPANVNMSPIVVHDGQFSIQGVVVGLLRRYR